jgi:hypothetical protein
LQLGLQRTVAPDNAQPHTGASASSTACTRCRHRQLICMTHGHLTVQPDTNTLCPYTQERAATNFMCPQQLQRVHSVNLAVTQNPHARTACCCCCCWWWWWCCRCLLLCLKRHTDSSQHASARAGASSSSRQNPGCSGAQCKEDPRVCITRQAETLLVGVRGLVGLLALHLVLRGPAAAAAAAAAAVAATKRQ